MPDLKFTPRKDEELSNLLEEGEGQFEVIKAIKKESKSGNPMISLVLKCWDAKGNQGNIFEYLILNDNVFSMRKIKHFCYSVGLEQKYESGELNAYECENKSGNLIIGIQKDKTGKYPDKNSVYDFLKKKEIDIKKVDQNKDLNDDIPW